MPMVTETSTESLLSPNEAAALLGITGEAIKQWIYRRRLRAVKLENGYWKIRPSDLQRYLHDRVQLRPRVLVLDFETTVLAKVSEAISVRNADVLHATNITDALLKNRKCSPRLIVARCQSEIDVWSFLRRLRASKRSKYTSILLIASAELTPAEMERAIDLRVSAFLTEHDLSFATQIDALLHSS